MMLHERVESIARLWAERTEDRGSLDLDFVPVLDDGASEGLRAKGTTLRRTRGD